MTGVQLGWATAEGRVRAPNEGLAMNTDRMVYRAVGPWIDSTTQEVLGGGPADPLATALGITGEAVGTTFDPTSIGTGSLTDQAGQVVTAPTPGDSPGVVDVLAAALQVPYPLHEYPETRAAALLAALREAGWVVVPAGRLSDLAAGGAPEGYALVKTDGPA